MTGVQCALPILQGGDCREGRGPTRRHFLQWKGSDPVPLPTAPVPIEPQICQATCAVMKLSFDEEYRRAMNELGECPSPPPRAGATPDLDGLWASLSAGQVPGTSGPGAQRTGERPGSQEKR